MRLKKFISGSLALGILINSIPINSFAGILSEDGRYETFEGSDITISDILEEDIVDVEMEGNTLVNLVKYNNISSSYNECKSYQMLSTKSNQLYTIVVDITSNTVDNGVWFSAYGFTGELKDSSYYLPESVKGDTKIASNGQIGRFVFKCGFSQRGPLDISHFILFSKDSTSGSFTASAMVFEGDLDESELPDKYFEGIKSVGQDDENGHKIEILLKNKNLWNIDDVKTQSGSKPPYIKNGDEIIYTNIGNYGIYVPIKAKKGQTLKISGIVSNVQNIRIFKESDNFKGMGIYTRDYHGVETEVSPNYSYTFTEDGVYHIRIWCKGTGQAKLTNFLVEISDNNTTYMESILEKIEIPLTEPLRSLPNGVKDRIIKRNGQWVIERNCISYTFNGSEDWILPVNQNRENSICFTLSDSLVYDDINNNGVVCDRIPYGAFKTAIDRLDIEGYGVGYASHYLAINKARLSDCTLDSFKTWLSINNINVVCQLATPIYEPIKADLVAQLFKDTTHISTNSIIPSTIKVTVDRTLNRATEAIELAKANPTVENLSKARYWNNLLRDSIKKDQLQEEINNITNISDMELEKKTATSNLDIYIKCENILQMSLDTNSISFEDFSGIEDVVKENVVNVTINSSLPYQINAYLPTEIQNADKTKTLDKSILNIKESSSNDYQTFANTTDKIVLKDNCSSGNYLTHGVDLKLAGGIAHEKDVYKATIKLEVEQK